MLRPVTHFPSFTLLKNYIIINLGLISGSSNYLNKCQETFGSATSCFSILHKQHASYCLCKAGEPQNCCWTNASHHRKWQMSEPGVMTALIPHLTHIFICVPLLMFLPLWYETVMEGPRCQLHKCLWGRAASPWDYADSWSLAQSHNSFPDNTRTMVIQTYCQQRTISNIMPSALSNRLGWL